MNAVAQRGVSVALACRTFGVSERCYRYEPKLRPENERIADLLVGLTRAHRTWGFGLCYLHLRNVRGHPWNHKRVYRIYRDLELNLRIKSSRSSNALKRPLVGRYTAPIRDRVRLKFDMILHGVNIGSDAHRL